MSGNCSRFRRHTRVYRSSGRVAHGDIRLRIFLVYHSSDTDDGSSTEAFHYRPWYGSSRCIFTRTPCRAELDYRTEGKKVAERQIVINNFIKLKRIL